MGREKEEAPFLHGDPRRFRVLLLSHQLLPLLLLCVLCSEKKVTGSRGTTPATALVLVLVLGLGFSSFRVNRRFMFDCALCVKRCFFFPRIPAEI
jgi:hypothetical protein